MYVQSATRDMVVVCVRKLEINFCSDQTSVHPLWASILYSAPCRRTQVNLSCTIRHISIQHTEQRMLFISHIKSQMPVKSRLPPQRPSKYFAICGTLNFNYMYSSVPACACILLLPVDSNKQKRTRCERLELRLRRRMGGGEW